MDRVTLTRRWDWQQQLFAYLVARDRAPFAWGWAANDCCSFADQGVEVMCGHRLMADLPRYRSPRGAARVLRDHPPAAFLDARLPRVSAGLAQRGDLTVIQIEGRDTVMLIEGDTLVGPGAAGLVRRPRADLTIAWSV